MRGPKIITKYILMVPPGSCIGQALCDGPFLSVGGVIHDGDSLHCLRGGIFTGGCSRILSLDDWAIHLSLKVLL